MFVDIGIELMKMQHTKGIVTYLMECGRGISLPTIVVENDDTYFNTTVSRIETDEVNDTDSLSFPVFNHHTHLSVSINIIGGVGYVVVKQISGIWHIGSSDIPKCRVVLDTVE